MAQPNIPPKSSWADQITPSLPGSSLRTELTVSRNFFPPLVCMVLAIFIVVFAVLMPGRSEQGRYLFIPGSGLPLLTAPLSQGHLYKLIVQGEMELSLGHSSDALYQRDEDGVSQKSPIISIEGELPEPDIAYPDEHLYIYYLPGRGKSVEINLIDETGIFSVLGSQYLDNSGEISATLEEADFRSWVEQEADYVSQEMVLHYTLDPVPTERDNLYLRIYDSSDNLVFEVDSSGKIGFREGAPLTLNKSAEEEFVWYGWGNCGEYSSPRPLAPGAYHAQLVFERKGEEFLAFPPDPSRMEMELAVTSAMSGQYPRLINRHLVNGENGFPYDTSRGIQQIQSYPDGIEGIYTQSEGKGDDFLYYGTRGPWVGYGEIAPPSIGSLQRTLNLIRGAYWEFYEADEQEFPQLLGITGEYDDATAQMVGWFQRTFNVDAKKEREILLRFDNLPPEYNDQPSAKELSYIIAGDTLEAILNLSLNVPKVPVPITLGDLDNLPAYDEDNPHYSLYHLFEEIGRRANSSHNFTPQPKSGEFEEGITYDISDDAFVSLLIAIGYQESGLAHVTNSGTIYRAGTGRGTATGYMQMTADVIGSPNYQFTFWDGDELISKPMGDWTFQERYFLRNINRCNIEMAAQFLKEMYDNCASPGFDKRFLKEMKLGGMLDSTDMPGLLRRAKLAGSSYNAGPEATRVMVMYLYDDPATEKNESVEVFFDQCDADMEKYLKKFREDLKAHAIGGYKFPLEATEEGRRRYQQLMEWLGPYWKSKYPDISWEEAALMKLDREVIGYCRNVAVNLPKLMRSREEIFKNHTFYVLLVPQEEEKVKEEMEPSGGVNSVTQKPTEGVMLPPKN